MLPLATVEMGVFLVNWLCTRSRQIDAVLIGETWGVDSQAMLHLLHCSRQEVVID